MDDGTIEVRRTCGCVLVTEHNCDNSHRWWFEETDAGRLVFVSEVVEYEERFSGDLSAGRHFVDEEEASVTETVESALREYGIESDIVDPDGKILVEAQQ